MATVLESFLLALGWDTKDLKKGEAEADESFRKTRQEASNTAQHLQETGQQAGEFYEGLAEKAAAFFAVLVGGHEVKEFAGEMLELEDETGKLSRMLGVNIEALQGWRRAAALEGGSSEAFDTSLKQLNSQLELIAIHGPRAEMALRLFKGLGIGEQELKGKDAIGVMDLLAEKMGKLSGRRALGLGQRLGLDEGTIRLLMKGREGVAAMVEEQEKLGTFSSEDAEKAEKFNDTLAMARTQFQMAAASVLHALLPALQWMGDKLRELGQWAQEHPTAVKAAIIGIAAALGVLAVAAGIAALSMFEVTIPLLLIAAAVGALAAAVVWLKSEWDKWAAGGDSVLAPMFERIKAFWMEFGKPILTEFKIVKEGIMDELAVLFDALKLMWGLFIGDEATVRKAWKALGEDLVRLWHLVRNTVLYVVGYTGAFMARAWETAWARMKAAAFQALDEVAQKIKSTTLGDFILDAAKGSPGGALLDLARGGAPAYAAAAAGGGGPVTTTTIGELHVHTQAADGPEVASEVGRLANSRNLVDHADGGF